MPVKVGVTGAAGRIGSRVVAELMQNKELELVQVNDTDGIDAIVQSLNKVDDLYVERGEGDLLFVGREIKDYITIQGRPIAVTSEENPSDIGWGETGVEIVEECTGKFTSYKDAESHLLGDVKKVIISAPAEGVPSYVMGVNQEKYRSNQDIISNSSCTTKAVGVPIKVLMDNNIKIYALLMDTAHAATNTDKTLEILDNMLIKKTGAAISTSEIIPELEGKMGGFAIRTPITSGAFANLYFVAYGEDLSAAHLNNIIHKAVTDPRYCERIGFIDGEGVSADDLHGRVESGIVVTAQTSSILLPFGPDGKNASLVSIVSGYDNQLAPAVDQVLLTKYIAEKL